MRLEHVALAYSSEQNSDRFFQQLLGLKKETPKALAPSLARAIFDVDTELMMVNYRGESLHFEVFVTGQTLNSERRIGHVCLAVEDLNAFLDRCHSLGIEVNQVPKGDRILTFVRDDGHLFEIKVAES